MTNAEVLTIKNSLLLFIILIFIIKLSIFAVDPSVMFFMGDSQSYLSTALHNMVPMDRSFSYGIIIKILTYLSHSLTSLIFVQIISSAFACIVLAYILIEFFSTKPITAYSMGILCAIEPIQTMFERYVMTETFSLFVFVFYVLVIFRYLKKASLVSLLCLQLLGVVLISIRLSFLPLVLVNTVLIPILNGPAIFKKDFTGTRGQALIALTIHLVFSIGLTYGLHSGYKHLIGHLSNRAPAYQHHSGFFLLADWSPAVEPQDFPVPELRDSIFGNLRYDLKNGRTRGAQRWMEGGIIRNIKNSTTDYIEAERLSKATAVNAFKRDPFGVAKLGITGFVDYWDMDYLHRTLIIDRGGDRPLDPSILETLRRNFSLDGTNLHELKTLTNVYYTSAKPWYLFLLCFPMVAGLMVLFSSRGDKRGIFALFVAVSCLAAVAIFLIERPTVRFLHPVAWLSFIFIGIALDRIQIPQKLNDGLGVCRRN